VSDRLSRKAADVGVLEKRRGSALSYRFGLDFAVLTSDLAYRPNWKAPLLTQKAKN